MIHGKNILFHGLHEVYVFSRSTVKLPQYAVFPHGHDNRHAIASSQNALKPDFHINGLAGYVLKVPGDLTRLRVDG